MKEKIHYAIEAALAVAVIILFVLQLTGSKKTSDTNMIVSDKESVTEITSIAYVDIDSLASTYTYQLDLNERLTRLYENSQATYAEQARRFQTEYGEFQRKLENNAFLTRERAESEQQRLIKKNEELQQLEARLSQEFDKERIRLQEEMRKAIITQVAEYNKEKGFQFIFGKSFDNILFATEVYNVTSEVIEYLNMKYAEDPVFKPNE